MEKTPFNVSLATYEILKVVWRHPGRNAATLAAHFLPNRKKSRTRWMAGWMRVLRKHGLIRIVGTPVTTYYLTDLGYEFCERFGHQEHAAYDCH